MKFLFFCFFNIVLLGKCLREQLGFKQEEEVGRILVEEIEDVGVF